MNDGVQIFDPQGCALGEGPLWHPTRRELFWSDIIGRKLYASRGPERREWTFAEFVTAAGWVDEARPLLASETGLWLFDIETGGQEPVVPLANDVPGTRSNDGRADPMGGFWIGTLGKAAEPDAGAIYRFHRGRLEKTVDRITISNALCFSPDGRTGYFTDSLTKKIMRHALDADGWPVEAPQVFADLSAAAGVPDGAIVDGDGQLWVAMWGGAELRCFAPTGALLRTVALPVSQPTCPALAGPDGSGLVVSSARTGLDTPGELDGATLRLAVEVTARQEPRVVLGSGSSARVIRLTTR